MIILIAALLLYNLNAGPWWWVAFGILAGIHVLDRLAKWK